MLLSTALIAPLDGRADADPDWLQGLLWDRRSASTRVEHIRVQRGPDYLRIAAFTVSADQSDSDDALRSLINATISATPELHRWRLL